MESTLSAQSCYVPGYMYTRQGRSRWTLVRRPGCAGPGGRWFHASIAQSAIGTGSGQAAD